MHILDRIVIEKRKEIAQRKSDFPLQQLEQSPLFGRSCTSLANALKHDAPGIIAEYKRRSPSEKEINQKDTIQEVVNGYETAGASGLSILTDRPFFGGSLEDLRAARALTGLPLLRKDFMLDPYQLVEAKAHGADVVLLIAAILDKETIISLTTLAHELGMEVLLEVHDREELIHSFIEEIDMLGVNNRNLKTFEVSLQTSIDLAREIGMRDTVLVSESGLKDPQSVNQLHQYGYSGFLIGTHFMKQEDPAKTAAQFIQKLRDED